MYAPRDYPLPARLPVGVLGLLVGDVGHSAKKLCQETLRHPARSGLGPGTPRSLAPSGFLPKPGAPPKHFFQHSPILSFLLATVSWLKNYSELSSYLALVSFSVLVYFKCPGQSQVDFLDVKQRKEEIEGGAELPLRSCGR